MHLCQVHFSLLCLKVAIEKDNLRINQFNQPIISIVLGNVHFKLALAFNPHCVYVSRKKMKLILSMKGFNVVLELASRVAFSNTSRSASDIRVHFMVLFFFDLIVPINGLNVFFFQGELQLVYVLLTCNKVECNFYFPLYLFSVCACSDFIFVLFCKLIFTTQMSRNDQAKNIQDFIFILSRL